MIELHAVREDIFTTAADCAVLFFAEDQKPVFTGTLSGKIKEALRKKQFSGKKEEVFFCDGVEALERILIVGLGKQAEVTLDSLRLAMARAVRAAKKLNMETLVVELPLMSAAETEIAAALADGVILTAYTFAGLRKKDADKKEITDVTLCVGDTAAVRPVLQRAAIVGEALWAARDLVNLPSNIVTPSYLEKQAKDIAKLNTKISLKVISFAEAKKNGYGRILRRVAGFRRTAENVGAGV